MNRSETFNFNRVLNFLNYVALSLRYLKPANKACFFLICSMGSEFRAFDCVYDRRSGARL